MGRVAFTRRGERRWALTQRVAVQTSLRNSIKEERT
jgi:hypothetical protein